MNMVKAADLIACLAHKGQIDKAGVSYINHPRTVASFVDTEEEKVVALLHDVLEDTDVKEDDLRPVFGDDIVDALLLLTREDGVDYFDYIKRIKESGKQVAINVKLADLKHNSDVSRVTRMTDKHRCRLQKYETARKMLEHTDLVISVSEQLRQQN